MKVKYTLSACPDCFVLVANGDLPDGRLGLGQDIARNLDAADRRNLCCGNTENDEEFSWFPCECCNSPLGGSRHELIVLEE